MIKVLIVEDEFLVRVGIKSAIDWNNYGFEIVGEASNGIEALNFLHTNSIDIILLDIEMPAMNGIELLKKIHEENIKVKVIILSSHNDFEYARQALKMGAIDYILKLSLKPDELLNLLINIKNDILEEKKHCVDTNNIKSNINLIDILKNENHNIDEYDKLNLSLKDDKVVVFYITIDNFYNINKSNNIKDIKLFNTSVTNIIYEMINDYSYGECIQYEKGIFIAVLNVRNNYYNSLNELAKNIQISLENYMQITVSIGIGKIVKGYKSIHKSFLLAQQVNFKKYFYGKSSVIFYDEESRLTNSDKEEVMFLSAEKEEKLKNSIEFNDINQSIELIDEFEFWVNKNKHLLEKKDVLREVEEMLYFFKRELKLCNQTFKDIKGYKDIIPVDKIDNIEFVKELFIWFKQFIDLYFKHLSKIRDNPTRKEIQKAIQYIYNNYSKPITVTEVANYLKISSSYFGYLFKKQYGYSFSKYLNDYRIKKSKELLRNSDLTISEIAQKVGYENVYYFSNVFKKNIGISPLQYRKEIQI